MRKTKVYYNSACPVCAAGIARQRRVLDGQADAVDWIDVHTDNGAVRDLDQELEFVRERLHVVDAAGAVHVGADAFNALFDLSAKQRWLAWIGRLPLLRDLLRWSYNAFAARLYRWNRAKGRW